MNQEEIEKEEKWWEKEEKLEEELRPEGKEMVVVNLVIRTSESYYNYRSIIYVIYKQPEPLKYEEPYVLDIRTVDVCCGVYQPYNCYDVEEVLEKLESEGYTVVKVFEA